MTCCAEWNLSVFSPKKLFPIIEQSKAALVVMGMAERTFEQELLGNATTSLPKNLNIPVLAVPSNTRFKDAKKILFASDKLSLSSVEQYSWFMQLAEILKVEVEFFSVDEKVEYLIEEQRNINQRNTEEFKNVKFIYKSIRSNSVVNAIKEEIKNYEADILVMVPQKYGFWDSLVHISKTRIMAAGLDIPLLSLPNF